MQRYLRPFTNSLQQRVLTFEKLNFLLRLVLYQWGIFFLFFFSCKWRKRKREQVLGTPTPTPLNLRWEKKMIRGNVLDLHWNVMFCSGADISTLRERAGGDRQALHFLLSFLISWLCDSVSSKPLSAIEKPGTQAGFLSDNLIGLNYTAMTAVPH